MMRTVTLSALRTVALAVSLAAFGVSAFPIATGASPAPSTPWPMFGQNLANTANGPATKIGTGNVATLTPKWIFTTGGDVSARAAVVNGAVYVPDWAGNFYQLNATNGKLVWAKNIATDYFGGSLGPLVVSRTSPFVDTSSNTVYIGTQTGAYLLAIDAGTGALKWKTQLDAHPLAIDTQSPIVFNGAVYVGVASTEEGAAAQPGYACCSFQGSMLKLDAATGAILWKTYMVPRGDGTTNPQDYTGVAVWGSSAVPDPSRNSVYITTGNNYSTPTDSAFTSCMQAGGTEASCLSPDDHIDSVLALDMGTGAVKWATRLSSGDDWNVACIQGSSTNCPKPAGADFDFGSGVNMFTIQTANGPMTIIGAGQKSGIYSAFDPDTGRVLWATQVGPGSTLGGIEWGSATDGQRIYVAIANPQGIPYTLQPSGQIDRAGSWSALDPATGRILWQTADPNGAIDIGPVAVANGVVYADSMAGSPTSKNMFALDAASGSILWSFAAGGSVNAGAVVTEHIVYWGSGYSHLGPSFGTSNNKFYAFVLG